MSSILTLDSLDPADTHILDGDGNKVYTVSTETSQDEQKRLTSVFGADSELLATLEWYEYLKYNVTIGNGEKQSLDHWLHASWVPLSQSVLSKGRQWLQTHGVIVR